MRCSLCCVLLAAGWWLARPVLTPAQVPPELASAESLALRVEAAERSLALAANLDEVLDLPTVDAELAKVREHLSRNPGDAAALVLSVRLGWVRDLLAYRDAVGRAFQEPSAGLPQPPSYRPYVETLDGVLARDSTMAAAHYWKARMLVAEAAVVAEIAAAAPDSPPAPGRAAVDSGEILRHAGAAVACDPGNVVYRELFAILLSDLGRLDSAASVLSHPVTAGTLLHLLVQDLLTFAPPPGAAPDAALGSLMSLTGLMGAADSEDPALMQYLAMRIRAWSTSASLADVEAHYRARWPGVRFFAAEGWEGAVSAAFVPAGSGWRAVRDSAEYASGAHDKGDVIMLLLLPPDVVAEVTAVAAQQGVREEPPRSGPRVGILYMDWRRGGGS